MAADQGLPTRVRACRQCRARKVKCDGIAPCARCQVSGVDCVYLESRRGKRKHDKAQSESLEERLKSIEAAIQQQQHQIQTQDPNPNSLLFRTPSNTHTGISTAGADTVNLSPKGPTTLSGTRSPNTWDYMQRAESMTMHDAMLHNSPSASFGSANPPSSYRNLSALTNQLAPGSAQFGGSVMSVEHSDTRVNEVSMYADKEAAVLAPYMVNWEHHGPGSWLSICSSPGLEWVAQRAGVTRFDDYAKELISTWTRRLTLDRSRLTGSRGEEPDPDSAWKYSYFENSHDATLGVVYRPEFESALRAHLRGELVAGDDPAWHALRHTVYASGCRVYHSESNSLNFTEAQNEAWRYFENALSVLVQLLLTPSGLLSVRALAAMTLFAEGLANPALEYMLSANAARLAQAKGLHRRPAKAWNLAEHDELHYSWLFWAIYWSDKQVSHRAGRPSAIDDDEISCQIPNKACPGSTLDVKVFTYLIQSAQISSRISKNLMSVRAFQQSPSDLLATVVDLDHQLHRWRDSIPIDIRPKDRLRSFQIPKDAQQTSTVLLHYAYYGGLMAIHTIFAYPWVYSLLFENDRSVVSQERIVASCNILAEAARNIVVIARRLEINCASIQWATFYYPMIGLINLFIHILKFPTLSSARSDVALLDVIAGHFGHMDFITSGELSFPFARHVATLARQIVQNASQSVDNSITTEQTSLNLGNDLDIPFEDTFYNNHNFNFDDWGVMSSVFTEDMGI